MIFKTLASGSNANCYLLETEEEVLVLECGVPFLEVKKELDFDTSKIKAILLTHDHKDHSKYIKDYYNAGVPICSSSGTLAEVGIKNVDGLKSGYWYKYGGFTITPFKVEHDCVDPYGFLIRHDELGTLLFATDSEFIRYDLSKHNIDHICIECNYSSDIITTREREEKINKSLASRIKNTHMELNTCLDFIKKNNSPLLKNVVLLHLSDSNSDANFFKEEVQKIVTDDVKIFIADSGLNVTVDRFDF